MNTDATPTAEIQPPVEHATGTRRGTLAALLAGSALGLAALRGAPEAEAAKGNKGKKGKNGKNKGNNGGKGNNGNHRNHGSSGNNGNNGSKGDNGNNGGNGNHAGDPLPSVRMVETTTVFDGDGIADAISKCPDGYVPINGGFFSSAPNPVLLTSTPRLDENAWLIEINGAQSGREITVTAVCLAGTVVVDKSASAKKGQRGRSGKKK
jgi:hypothetical protein